MKRIVSALLAVVTIVSLLTVAASARGLILAVPNTVPAHNLEAFGLHTMNVYSTEIPPTVDGVVGTGEYPGPNNGCSLSSGIGDNLWMSAHSSGSEGYGAYYDITGLTAEDDVPAYVKSYITYDNEYFYFAVSAVVKSLEGSGRSSIYFDVRNAFSQNDNLVVSSTNYSQAWIRYYVTPAVGSGAVRDCSPYPSNQSRNITLYNGSYSTISYSSTEPYVDEDGLTWNGSTYRRAENSSYKISALSDGRWSITLEARQPLGDVLRVTDVEYSDGTPIDYVPEWGSWGVGMQLVSSANKTNILPNGEEYSLVKNETIYAQTMFPAFGMAYTGMYTRIGDMTFTNSMRDAVLSSLRKEVYFLTNPVHFLGTYDPTFDYDNNASQSPSSLTYTSRITRPRNSVLTSGLRGVNNRVVGAATNASGATGDNITVTLVLAVVMLLLAAAAVVLVVMKKRSRNR